MINRFTKSIWIFFASVAILSGCQSEVIISDQDCILLIKGITEMPFKSGIEVDGNYYSIAERSAEKQIAECLLSQITNTDPVVLQTAGPGPKPQFVVGDISVFMLTGMYDIPYTTFLSEEGWDHMGVHEYYRYVKTDDARATIAKILQPIVEANFD